MRLFTVAILALVFTVSGMLQANAETLSDSTESLETPEGFTISYEISGAQIAEVSPSRESNSVLISMDSTESGSLVITLPREAIDATIGGNDENFFVLVDGEDMDYMETKTNENRTLTIQFPAGTQEIEIIGTFAIPEFGTIAVMILAVAVISAILIVPKSKLNFTRP